MSSGRFFIDERCGCIAIRDRTRTDPEESGLHQCTEGVVWYRNGRQVEADPCPTCGHRGPLTWSVSAHDKAEAILECARLNAIHERTKDYDPLAMGI